jgi:hypothetical protein
MRPDGAGKPQIFLSTVPATPADRRLALAVVALSAANFLEAAPFSRIQLPTVWGFIPTSMT